MNGVHTRKFPRRRFQRSIGFLFDGKYYMAQGVEVGEGGMALALGKEFPVHREAVVNFQIPDGSFVCVRVELRNVAKNKTTGHFVTGCLFKDLQFEHRREIRSFVSARSEQEA